jgi:hypothetical protein
MPEPPGPPALISYMFLYRFSDYGLVLSPADSAYTWVQDDGAAICWINY